MIRKPTLALLRYMWAGSTRDAYFMTNLYPNRPRPASKQINSFQTLVNDGVDSLAMRISYKLNLKGTGADRVSAPAPALS